MLKLPKKRKQAGQALVEFALTITVLFTFLSGIIDAGLAFFAYQGLKGAAYEAVSYGALFPLTSAGAINEQEIRDRLRYEGGAPSNNSGLRFVNLFDLNNNGAPDTLTEQRSHIGISFVDGAVAGTSPLNCSNPASLSRQFCDIRVSVRYTYRSFFFAASIFGAETIELTATQQQTLP